MRWSILYAIKSDDHFSEDEEIYCFCIIYTDLFTVKRNWTMMPRSEGPCFESTAVICMNSDEEKPTLRRGSVFRLMCNMCTRALSPIMRWNGICYLMLLVIEPPSFAHSLSCVRLRVVS